MRTVSIVIPAMNEEETIVEVLSEIRQVVESNEMKDYKVEVFVVDDHSVDRTSHLAKACGASVLSNEYSPGKGNALRYGFERTSGDFIVMLDADHSHRAEDLPTLLKPLEKGAGLVIASRILGGSEEYTKSRAFGNIFLTYMFGLLHDRYLSDALNGFKAFRKRVFFDHDYSSTDFEIEVELLVNAIRSGCYIVEVPSHERKRGGGKAKSRCVKHGSKFLLRMIKEALANRYETTPGHPRTADRTLD